MSTASKVRPALMILLVYFLSTWAAATPVQAQGAVPDITLKWTNRNQLMYIRGQLDRVLSIAELRIQPCIKKRLGFRFKLGLGLLRTGYDVYWRRL
ncbi:MAG: hypothetical protein Ct9H90mP23_2160 [Methanobacteriota archaeon]|nr:MAG: hypothetical protein Ct9H90mP23_2160 [Euryarchaeota archaeon]